MDRLGTLLYNEVKVGTLTESADGFRFVYDAQWKGTGFPIGFNFPLDRDSYYKSTLFPFFENMLSEGWLLGLQSQEEKIDSADSFGLLLANGKDLPGAFTVQEVRR